MTALHECSERVDPARNTFLSVNAFDCSDLVSRASTTTGSNNCVRVLVVLAAGCACSKRSVCCHCSAVHGNTGRLGTLQYCSLAGRNGQGMWLSCSLLSDQGRAWRKPCRCCPMHVTCVLLWWAVLSRNIKPQLRGATGTTVSCWCVNACILLH